MGSVLRVSSFTLADPTGAFVIARLVTTRTDTGAPIRTSAFLMPLEPLTAQTRYTASARGDVAGVPFDVTWDFTTVQDSPLKLTASQPALGSTPGSTATLTLTGGTGQSYGISYRWSYSYSTSPSTEPPSFFTADLLSTNVLLLTRSNVSCSAGFSDCRLEATGKDSSGASVAFQLPIR
jgi:hypothetical protein